MRSFISSISIILGLGCFIGIGNAANFSDKSIGISIDLDDDLAEQTQWQGWRIFSSPDNAASVFIRSAYDLRLYDLRESLKGGSWHDGGVDLDVMDTEKPAQVTQGSGVLVPVTGRVGEYKVRGVFGGFSGYDGQDFILLAAARPDYWSDWKLRIKAMIDSIRFIELDYWDMIAGWYARLEGKSLVQENPVARGPLVPKPINLCSNGTVADKKPANTQPAATAAQQTVWNGYAWVTVPVAPMPRPPGRWRIEPIRGKPTLLIRHGPLPQEFTLEMEGDQLYVNGKPYSITENTLCQ
ncbi:MAG: hypothetical protein PVG45_13380 [Gammaproteobacteria bacterium]|jgi:hypothetical protein